jgi:hypothetical protein
VWCMRYIVVIGFSVWCMRYIVVIGFTVWCMRYIVVIGFTVWCMRYIVVRICPVRLYGSSTGRDTIHVRRITVFVIVIVFY